MRSILSAFFSVTLLCGAALAQQTPPTPDTQTPRSDEQPGQNTQANANQTQAKNMKIAPGSVIPVQLAKTVDAKKAKTGDEVVATVTQDMKANSGEVLVPKDTKIIGHVTEAQARSKEQKQSELGIAFEQAVVKGNQMQLPMSIQAVIAPQTNATEPGSAEQAPSAGGGNAPSGSMGGRAGATGANSSQSQAGRENPPQAGASDNGSQAARPPITANTQGVIGMSDVKLGAATQNAQQGSVLTSEKNNVKIEKGTMMLLKVNQPQ